MNEINISWLWSFILLPFIVGFSKSYINSFLQDYSIYKNRMFDDDQNPKTGQSCYIKSSATGNWSQIVVSEYTFSIFFPSKRTIKTIQQQQKRGYTLAVVYTYQEWKAILKGKFIEKG